MATRDGETYRPRYIREGDYMPGPPLPGSVPGSTPAPVPPTAPAPQQFVQPFSYEAPRYQAPRGRSAQAYQIPPYQVGQAPEFYAPEFVMPQGEDVFADPSYQFRLNEGLKALERSAAARGTLRSGNTLQDLQRWGQDYAASEYAAAADRAARQHEINYQTRRDMYAPSLLTWQAQNEAGLTGWQAQLQARQDAERRAWDEYVFRLDDEFRREQMLFGSPQAR